MPSSTDPAPAFGQIWDWTGDVHMRLMLICPVNESIGGWKVLFFSRHGGTAGIGSMSGLWANRPVLDGYTYIEG